jgi:two-component system chemotaxis response regulator CheY
VVQWDESRVQDILTGFYRPFDHYEFGHAITDGELNQLKSAGRVEYYNRNYVWLYALPEPNRFQADLKTQERVADRVRAYYLNTTLPVSEIDKVRVLMKKLEMQKDFFAYIRGRVVAIAGRDGTPFLHFTEAEDLQKRLVSNAPELLKDSAIAFIEIRQTDETHDREEKRPEENTDLSTIIASQSDTSLTKDKRVVLLAPREDDQKAVHDLCVEMKMDVKAVEKGSEAISLLEDGHSDLLIMDLELPDMHGWAMIGKLREINSLRNLPVVIIADGSSNNQTSLAFTVAHVNVFLSRPISRARLRQNIWMVLRDQAKV